MAMCSVAGLARGSLTASAAKMCWRWPTSFGPAPLRSLLWHHEMALYVFAVVGGLVWLATPPSDSVDGEILWHGLWARWGVYRFWRTRLVVAECLAGW